MTPSWNGTPRSCPWPIVGAGNGAQGSKEIIAGGLNEDRFSQRVEAYVVLSGSRFPAPVVRIESEPSVYQGQNWHSPPRPCDTVGSVT